MNQKHTRNSALICAGATLLTLIIFLLGGFTRLENASVDFRFHLRGDRPTDPNIAVVVIDEHSLKQLGRWPWPRQTHARLARILTRGGAKVVAFDTIFTEADERNPTSDAALARAAEDTGNVVSAFFFEGGFPNNPYGDLPLFPYPDLFESSQIGFVNNEPDSDGVTRRTKLYAINGEAAFPSFAAASYAMYKGKGFNEIISDLPVVVSADPFQAQNELFINFDLPDDDSYPEYSYADVLDGTVSPSVFEGKIVLIGPTAAGLFDLKAIPYVSTYAGVKVHANVIDNLLNDSWIRFVGLESTLVGILLVGILLGFMLPRFSPWGKLGAFVLVMGLYLVLAMWLFSSKDTVLGLVPPFTAAILSYVGVMFYRLVIEEREKRKIKGSFKQYLSPKIIDVITKDPGKLKLGGEEREVTVFFLDIANFTAMSEKLKPTQLVEVMNECLTAFSSTILQNEGLINKYIGDCIMAFWNAPAEQPKHASMACKAALDCLGALKELNRKFQSRGLPNIDCRVGINTGVVVVGNMGSKERFDYTVMGDPVNLASRLEGANKKYHTHIMISDTTFDLAREDIEARDLDLIQVVGKKEARKVYELLSEKSKMPEEWKNGRRLYHDALRLYRNRQFDEAIHAFQEVFDYVPNDPVTREYLRRAREFRINPPPSGWDGAHKLDSK